MSDDRPTPDQGPGDARNPDPNTRPGPEPAEAARLDEPGELAPASGRASSVRLGTQTMATAASRRVRMDAANQSLADALKITFRLVMLAMIVLAGLYVFSGLRTISEGERGIATRFGRATDSTLGPGPHLGLPFPIGDVIRVGTAPVDLRLARDFFPSVRNEAELDVPANELSNTDARLDPETDGSLITADLNIAHAQFTVTYRRLNHDVYAENILPELESELVRVSVRRGIVRAVAQIEIDDFLKDRDTAAARAKEIAQQSLDEIDSGIRIEQLVMNRKFAPTNLLDRFAAVQSAQQEASEAEESARSEASSALNSIAGAAATVLTEQIDAYERAVDLARAERDPAVRREREAEAEVILTGIDALLEGREARVGGTTYDPGLVSGEVTAIVSLARDDAFATRYSAEADWQTFSALHDNYLLNPSLTLTREYARAMRSFVDRPFVQSFKLREGSSDLVELRINEDRDFRDEQIISQQTAEGQAARERRDRERRLRRQELNREEARQEYEASRQP